MRAFARMLFAVVVAYPVALLWLGLTVRHRERLPLRGPAIVAANHNSHLDILTLFSLFPLLSIHRVQPAAAADYFMRNRWIAWFTRTFVGIIPVVRGGVREGRDPLEGCYEALARGQVLVIFPEGTRGEPEQMGELKSGIWYLARRFPSAPVVPVFLHGLGRSMPRGSFVPLPFFVDVLVGRPLGWREDKAAFMQELGERFEYLTRKADRPELEVAHPPAPTFERKVKS